MAKEIQLTVHYVEREMTPQREAALRALVRSWYTRYQEEQTKNRKTG